MQTIGEIKVVSSIREKIYQVEKQKKVDRRNAKQGVAPEPVKEPEVKKVIDSGEVKATPSPEPKAKKKGRPKKEK
tara:strand:- start:95 stop:319 length:225 start_codon:yes stop_codon:yes gene_type:complete